MRLNQATQCARQARGRSSLYDVVHLLARCNGGSAGNLDGAVAFQHDPTLSFATDEIAGIAAPLRPNEPCTLRTTFLGLAGAPSPLPQTMVEHLAHHDAPGDTLAFFGALEHRLLTLLCEGVLQRRMAATYRHDASDLWSQRWLQWSRQAADSLPPWRRLRLMALLWRKPTRARMEAALADVWSSTVAPHKVRVVAFTGGWLPASPQAHWRLGQGKKLGHQTLLGTHMRCPQSAFDVRVGPLDAGEYAACVADRPRLIAETQGVTQLFNRTPSHCRMRLQLAPLAQEPWHLGRGPALGSTTFIGRCNSPVTVGFENATRHHAS